MNLPPLEVCRELLALHLLLGSQLPEGQRDAFRTQLLELLAAHGLKWSDWPAFFAAQNVQPSQSLPPVDSSKWKKHCEKARQLHSAMASADKDAAVAYKKLRTEIANRLVKRSAGDPGRALDTPQSDRHEHSVGADRHAGRVHCARLAAGAFR
jgi:hypothetical protein